MNAAPRVFLRVLLLLTVPFTTNHIMQVRQCRIVCTAEVAIIIFDWAAQ